MTQKEVWKRILRKAYADDSKALEAYLMTQRRIIWAEKELMLIEEREQAMTGIERAYISLSAN